MKPPEPLNEADVEAVFRMAVPTWTIERLNTRLGTADVVKLLKDGGNGSYGGVGPCEDGPYTEWARWTDRTSKGFDCKVTFKTDGEKRIVRQGTVTWNRLANMATLRALELKRQKPLTLEDAQAGAQGALF